MEICREVRRVLRDDGVVWLNYGDCYNSAASNQMGQSGSGMNERPKYSEDGQSGAPERGQIKSKSLAQGSLMMMPHRVAIALQQDGWIVRQDLVWFKRNPMPESIAGTRWVKHRIKEKRSKHASDHNIKGGTEAMLRDASIHQGIDENWVPEYVDCPGCEKCIPNDGFVLKRGSFRHTRAHEYVFQLVKGPKMKYWSNQEAVREGLSAATIERDKAPRGRRQDGGGSEISMAGIPYTEELGNMQSAPSGRNPRSVLDVPTAPYKGAHYATFPPNLIAPLIRATCPRWACPVCGQGWAAVVDTQHKGRWDGGSGSNADSTKVSRQSNDRKQEMGRSNVLGYRPTCEHPHTQEEAVPGIVFDPFVGSGTTVKVAQDLLRKGVGIDISMEYLDLQAKVRIGQGSPSNVLDDLPLFQ